MSGPISRLMRPCPLFYRFCSGLEFVVRYSTCVSSLGNGYDPTLAVLVSSLMKIDHSIDDFIEDFFTSAITALILLSMGILPVTISQWTSFNLFSTNTIFCKIRVYINQFSAMSCRWLLAMACIDRYVACSTHFNLRKIASVHIARRLSIVICLFWLIFPIHTLIFLRVSQSTSSSCAMPHLSLAMYHGIYSVTMGGLPPLIMLTSSFLIWTNLRKRSIVNTLNQSQRHARRRDDQVLLLLSSQVFIFSISSIPFLSNNLYRAVTLNLTGKSADRIAIEGFFLTIAELLVYVYPATSFYSNTLTSRRFRSELYKMFKFLSIFFAFRQRRVLPIF